MITTAPIELRGVPVAHGPHIELCRTQGISVVARAIGWPATMRYEIRMVFLKNVENI